MLNYKCSEQYVHFCWLCEKMVSHIQDKEMAGDLDGHPLCEC